MRRWGDHLFGLFLESRCRSAKFAFPLKHNFIVLVNFCIVFLEFLSLSSSDKIHNEPPTK